MNTNTHFLFNIDSPAKKLYIERVFQAAPADVWNAWTIPSLLNQWWAPEPWKAETKNMDFREGGSWIYAMAGPDGTRNWSRADFLQIQTGEKFVSRDCFCDENGIKDESLPAMIWTVEFMPKDALTLVRITIDYDTTEDMHKVMQMNFREGFTAGLQNLDKLLSSRS